MCKATDTEIDLEVGAEVSKDSVDECFLSDIDKVIEDCIILYDDFYTLPDEAQLIVANMMFNLGRPRLTNFVRMRKAVNEGNWQEAKIQMLDSKWAKQVPNRAERLSERMGNIT